MYRKIMMPRWGSNTDVHTLISQQSLHSYAKQMYGAINDMKGTKYVEFRVNSTMQSSCRDKTHLRAISWWHEWRKFEPGSSRNVPSGPTRTCAPPMLACRKLQSVWQKCARGGTNLNADCLLKDLKNKCKKNTVTLDIGFSVTMYNLK